MRVLFGVYCGEWLRQWCCWLTFDIGMTFDIWLTFNTSDTREGLAVGCVVRNNDDRQKCWALSLNAANCQCEPVVGASGLGQALGCCPVMVWSAVSEMTDNIEICFRNWFSVLEVFEWLQFPYFSVGCIYGVGLWWRVQLSCGHFSGHFADSLWTLLFNSEMNTKTHLISILFINNQNYNKFTHIWDRLWCCWELFCSSVWNRLNCNWKALNLYILVRVCAVS